MLVSYHRTCMKKLQYADPYVSIVNERSDISSQQPQDYSIDSSKIYPIPQCRWRYVSSYAVFLLKKIHRLNTFPTDSHYILIGELSGAS